MASLGGALAGGIIGVLVSYLMFKPTFLGISPSIEEWLQEATRSGSPHQATIIICGLIGLLIGAAVGEIIGHLEKLTKNKK